MGCFIAFVILEVYVRVFDPFPILLRGGRIDLPANSHLEFSTNGLPGLDPIVNVSYNSLGFRGAEPPKAWEKYLTIICVGGSTTQCLYLSEGTTWPDRLGAKLAERFDRVWINNGGLDGHSTFGHLELLDQYIARLHPKVLLLYAGLNDVERSDLNAYDASMLRSRSRTDDSLVRSAQRALLRNSDAFALLDNLRMQMLARRKGLTHGKSIGHQRLSAEIEHVSLAMESRQAWLDHRDPACLAGYRSRLRNIVNRCKNENILCVLLTQPVLYGEGVDDMTGINLETIRLGDTDSWSQWQLLKKYNQVTAEVASESAIPFVDVASQLPKSSKYFYDMMHCNIEGASQIATIVFPQMKEILSLHFSEYTLP